ncbi:hypothetical protein HYV11_03125 [Candidatus Dependentiae bacterium]|nr:hypothetical protein [Candidatus Dependentiae bacterium]
MFKYYLLFLIAFSYFFSIKSGDYRDRIRIVEQYQVPLFDKSLKKKSPITIIEFRLRELFTTQQIERFEQDLRANIEQYDSKSAVFVVSDLLNKKQPGEKGYESIARRAILEQGKIFSLDLKGRDGKSIAKKEQAILYAIFEKYRRYRPIVDEPFGM